MKSNSNLNGIGFWFKDALACVAVMALVFVILAVTGPLGTTAPALSL